MRVKRSIMCSIMAALPIMAVAGLPHADSALAQDEMAPYWVSLRFDEVRMRVGPGLEYPIEWLYRRQGLPVKVLRVREGWSFVEDPDGAQGWITSSQLSGTRTVIVIGEELASLREEPSITSALRWRAEPGVVGELLRCRETWCEISVTGRIGWVEAGLLWGDEDPPQAVP